MMWGGRFEHPPADTARAFTRSFPWDRRLFREDLVASIAHARMLGARQIIAAEDAAALIDALEVLFDELVAAGGPRDVGDEDIHSYVERVLIERLGDVGRRLHTARSRNDQVATDFRLYCKGTSLRLAAAELALLKALAHKAAGEAATLVPGFTHLQTGQPVTLGHYLLGLCEMFKRDVIGAIETFDIADECPLGVGAVAGVGFEVDREAVAAELRFARVSRNSLDAVADRDYVLRLLHAYAVVMVHLSRWAEDLVIWVSPGFRMATFDDAYATGSSLMPQKKNPDVAELVRGKAGTVVGVLAGALATLKGVPLAYGLDLQEDKQAVMRSVDDVQAALNAMTGAVDGLTFNRVRMAELSVSGHALATDVADYLVERDVPFRTAHELAGQVVRAALDQELELWELGADTLQAIDSHLDVELLARLTPAASVARRSAVGGTAPPRVEAELAELHEWIALHSGRLRELIELGLPERLRPDTDQLS